MKQVLISSLPVHQQKQLEQKNIQTVIDSFRECLACEDLNWSKVMRTGRELQNHIDLCKAFEVEEKRQVVELLWGFFTYPDIAVTFQAKIALLLLAVLKNKVPALVKQNPFRWTTLHDVLKKVHLGNAQDGYVPVAGPQVLRFHETSILALIKSLKWYLPYDDTVKEILEKYEPMMQCSLCKDVFLGQSMVAIFTPPPRIRSTVTQKVDNQALVDQIIHKWWPLVSFDTQWDQTWCTLLRRIGKHDLEINWAPYLPRLFNYIQDGLKISIRGRRSTCASWRGKPSKLHNYGAGVEMRSLAKFAVMLIGSGSFEDYSSTLEEGLIMGTEEEKAKDKRAVSKELAIIRKQDGEFSAGFLYLRRLLCAVSTLFNPSNHSRESYTLSIFLNFLCMAFVKRIGRGVRPMSQQDRDGFIKLTLPYIKTCLVGKVDVIILMAQSAFRHLAWVEPQAVYDEVAPFLFAAMNPRNLTQTHLAPAAMKALDVLFQPWLHKRRLLHHILPDILRLTLPGIDPNDISKTVVTLRLYVTLLQWIPIVNTAVLDSAKLPSVDALYRSTEQEEETENELTTARDAMWQAGSFLSEWALSVLDRVLRLLEMQGERGKAQHMATGEASRLYQVWSFFENFFCQMDPHTQAKAEDRVCEWILGNCCSNSLLELKVLSRCCFAASYRKPHLVQTLLLPLMQKATEKFRTDWALVAIGGIVRVGGVHLLGVEAEIIKAIDHACASPEKTTRKLGVKLLRRVLKGLTDAYELSLASFSESYIEEHGWEAIAVKWGYTPGWNDVDPVYHVASDKEMEMALRLKQLYLNKGLDTFKEDCRSMLDLVFHTIRGAAGFLDEEERQELIARMCEVLKWLLEDSKYKSDYVAHGKAFKVLKVLALSRGGRDGNFRSDKSQYYTFITKLSQSSAVQARFLQQNYECETNNSLQNNPHLMLSRYSMRQYVRSVSVRQCYQHPFDQAKVLKGVPVYTLLLETLFQCCIHEWPQTRKAAQKFTREVSLRFPWEAKRMTKWVIDLFDVQGLGEEKADAQLTGAAYLLSYRSALRWIVTNWELFDHFIRKVVMNADVSSLATDKQNSANLRVQKIILAVFHAWNSIPFKKASHQSIYDGLLHDLSSLSHKSMPWRKQLSISACLIVMFRHDMPLPVPMSIWNWFIQGVASTSVPLQVTSVFAISKLIMITQTASTEATRSQMRLLQPLLLDETFLSTYVHVISENRKSVPSADGSTSNEAKWSLGVADIMSLAKARKSSGWYTQNRTRTESRKFYFSHAQIALEFTRAMGLSFVQAMVPVLQQSLDDHSGTGEYENRLVGCAEIIGGILLAAAKSSEGEQINQLVLPIVFDCLKQQSLSFATCWMGAARYCSTYKVNQEAFLKMGLEHAAAELASAQENSFTSAVNSLRLLQVLWMESDTGSRSFQWAKQSLCDIITSNLQHHFKSVRHEIGEMVVAVVQKLKHFDSEQAFVRDLIQKLADSCWTSEGELELYGTETALSSMNKLGLFGSYEPFMVTLLPVVVAAVHTSDLELNKLGKAVAGFVALQMERNATSAIRLLADVGLVAESWLLRAITISMIDIILTRQAGLMGLANTLQVIKTLNRMLLDPIAEVHKSAMTAILNSTTTFDPCSKHITSMINLYTAQLDAKNEEPLEDDSSKIAGVLGLSAVIGAFPYSVPFTYPIVTLAIKSRTPGIVGRYAKIAVEDFKRTHLDTWHEDKLKFSMEDLEELDYSATLHSGYA